MPVHLRIVHCGEVRRVVLQCNVVSHGYKELTGQHLQTAVSKRGQVETGGICHVGIACRLHHLNVQRVVGTEYVWVAIVHEGLHAFPCPLSQIIIGQL